MKGDEEMKQKLKGLLEWGVAMLPVIILAIIL